MDPIRGVDTETEAQPRRGTLERLFDTAATLFWEKGFAATSTREIAAALGIQQASLYYHIASKEDLFYQLCVASLEQIHNDVESAIHPVLDPLGRIRTLIRAHLTTLLNYQVRHVMMLTELRALSDKHHLEVLALRNKYAGLVRSVLEDAQAAGAIRTDIPAKYLCLALLNVLNWAILWYRRDRELEVDRLTGIFTPVYLGGAARWPQSASPSGKATLEQLPRRRRKPAKNAEPASDGGGQSTPERMLKTAAALFSRKGYAATSTREIASVMRIQKPSLYYHIQSKEDLLYNICKSSLEQIRRDVAAAVEPVTDPLERTRTLVRAHIESMLRDQDQHSATLSEMRALSNERLAHVISLRDAYESLVRSVVEGAQKAGALRGDIPAKYLCLYLLGLMNRVEVWYHRDGPLSPTQLGDLFAMIFLSGAGAAPCD
jgi:TetR/AcrR family transcriptional regulator, cholesterol catabolism regulator